MALLIIAGILTIILLRFAIVKLLGYWRHHVPQYSSLITIREIVLDLISYRALSERVQKVYNDFPDARYVGIYQFGKPVLALKDPDLIKQITVNDFDHFVDRFPVLPEGCVPYLDNNLLALKGDKWREMRTILRPSFSSSKMKVMFSLISDYAKQFVTYFEEQNCETISVEMKHISARFTTDVIATSLFSINCDSLRNPNNEFYTVGKVATSITKRVLNKLKFLLIIALPKLAKMFEIELISNRLVSVITNLIKINIEYRENGGIVSQDMIHLLLKARKSSLKYDTSLQNSLGKGSNNQKKENHQKYRLTDDDIIAQVLIFFLAGFETVSTLTSFMAYELAVNVDVQTRLQMEIDDTLQECDGNLTYEALSKMKYMDMVIAETLRKWPPTVFTDRACTKPYTIQPVKKGEMPVSLRKGDILWLLVFGLHRDPHIFSEPECFDPERFNEDNKSKISHCYMPFGMGPRMCIGSRFALMETKLLFFYILSKFHLTVTNKTHVPLQVESNQFSLAAKGGIWLGLKSRK